MIIISKDINTEEIEAIYNLFRRCQAGDKSVLNDLFKTQNRQIRRVDELTEEYRIKRLESTLNPELEKLNQEYENEDRETGFKSESVIFSYDILNRMLSKMKREYSKESVDKKSQTYKKYYPGKYDITEFAGIMCEVIIAIFQAELDGNGCVTFNDTKNKEVPIIDGVSLLKNIAYFCSIQANEGQAKRCKDIPGIEQERGDGSQSESLNRFDRHSFVKWKYKEAEKWNNYEEILRLLVYADVLEWLRKHRDNIKSLFKRDSYEVQAIIDTILSNENVFISEMDGCLQLVKQKELQRLVYEQTGKTVVQSNMSIALKLIEQKLIDHLLYSMNYKIVDGKEKQRGSEIKIGNLQELDKKKYFKLFGRESMLIYKICSLYRDGTDREDFLNHIREHDDMVIPVLSLVKGRKKYDMINLIQGDLDVIDNDISHDQIISDILHTLIRNFKNEEAAKITEFRKQYKVADRFINGKAQMWEADIQDDYLRIRFWANENIKHPVGRKIELNNVLVYEGYENFYLCDESEMLCYLMPKCRRVITKSDSSHNVFFEKIA